MAIVRLLDHARVFVWSGGGHWPAWYAGFTKASYQISCVAPAIGGPRAPRLAVTPSPPFICLVGTVEGPSADGPR